MYLALPANGIERSLNPCIGAYLEAAGCVAELCVCPVSGPYLENVAPQYDGSPLSVI